MANGDTGFWMFIPSVISQGESSVHLGEVGFPVKGCISVTRGNDPGGNSHNRAGT